MNSVTDGCTHASGLPVTSVQWLLPTAAKPKQTEGSIAQHWTHDIKLPNFCMEVHQVGMHQVVIADKRIYTSSYLLS